MLAQQKPKGHWDPPGQFKTQKRPDHERAEVITRWTMLSLTYGERKEETQSRQRALEVLKDVPAGVSTESLALRALIDHRLGDTKSAEARLQELLAQQNTDGGWNWYRDGKASDAFATGLVLDVLGSAGVDANSPAIQRARAYLLQSQREDGSWSVASGPISSGNPVKIIERDTIYSYWGTAWSTLGLLRTLPKP